MKIKEGQYINDHTGKECFVRYTSFFSVTYEYIEDGDKAQPYHAHYKTFARHWSPARYHTYVVS